MHTLLTSYEHRHLEPLAIKAWWAAFVLSSLFFWVDWLLVLAKEGWPANEVVKFWYAMAASTVSYFVVRGVHRAIESETRGR